jgi:prevent-host-death family protein
MVDILSTPELVPISELRTRQNDVLSRLAQGPVVLTQHGRAAAVLVDTEVWNRLVERIEFLEEGLHAVEARQRIDT